MTVTSVRIRPAFRRLALVLAAAQLVAYATAPVLEAANERNPGPTHIEAPHSTPCVPIHAPDACLACQLLTATATRPEPVRVPASAGETRIPERLADGTVAPRPPPRPTQSRAPPATLA